MPVRVRPSRRWRGGNKKVDPTPNTAPQPRAKPTWMIDDKLTSSSPDKKVKSR